MAISLLRRDGRAAQGSSSSSVTGSLTPIICPVAAASETIDARAWGDIRPIVDRYAH